MFLNSENIAKAFWTRFPTRQRLPSAHLKTILHNILWWAKPMFTYDFHQLGHATIENHALYMFC